MIVLTFVLSQCFIVELLTKQNSQYFCISVCNFLTAKVIGLDVGLDGKI